MTDANKTQPYTVVNIGKGYAPEPSQKTADKPIDRMTHLDLQKACRAYFDGKGAGR